MEEAAAAVAGESVGARRWESVNQEEVALASGTGPVAAPSAGLCSAAARENQEAEAHLVRVRVLGVRVRG